MVQNVMLIKNDVILVTIHNRRMVCSIYGKLQKISGYAVKNVHWLLKKNDDDNTVPFALELYDYE